ncbi:hypothetical protein [Mucilaginibacter sp.]|uniref:hypothetical protein n=1 Tax=Mucilaginibacter sp. TaxID=1882438 RepID=UPI003D099B21
MKVVILGILFFASITVSAQQRAATFQAAAKSGLTVYLLNKQYSNALDNDSNKSVFKGNAQKKFYNAYVALLADMGTYLHANGFTWGKPIRVVHRIYFEGDGTIDHYLLNLDAAGMDAAKQARFLKLLNQFAANYKLRITADKKFAQCGPAIYQD